jgi:RimJ/RimL family protein N-acetyltransferase
MHEVYGDREVMRYIGSESSFSDSVEESERRLQRLIAHQDKHGFSMWAVVSHETGTVMGDCGLIHYAFRGPEIELGYRLGQPYWGRGYATEAARAWVDHGFDELGLERIIAVSHPENVASQRVLEKIGMQRERMTEYEGGAKVVLFAVERDARS